MRLPHFNNDFSPYFVRDGKVDRVVIHNNVKLVVGTEIFNCSGTILARHSTVFLDMIQKQSEIYLDEFTDCLEGLLDGIDLLYGAEITLSLQNIQPLLKFSLIYKIEGVFEVCLQWVKKELSMVNLFTFCKIGLFVKSVEVERGEVLGACKDFILTSTAEDLLEVSKNWPQDENVINFLFDKDMLSVTMATITNWVNTESKVVMVLDKIEEGELQAPLAKLPNKISLVAEKIHDGETAPKVKRACQSSVTVRQTSAVLDLKSPLTPLYNCWRRCRKSVRLFLI